MSGSFRASSRTVFPMRPAAPTSSTRTGEFFMVASSELSLRFEVLERLAQARLVRFAHLAQRQTNFRGHRTAPAERCLHGNRIRLDKQVFEQRQEFPDRESVVSG